MKKLREAIFILFLLSFNGVILANEDISSEGFEALFLKIASEAFFSEYEDEKNITYTNRDKIKIVEEKLQILHQKMQEFQQDVVEVKNLKKQLQTILNDFSPQTFGKLNLKLQEIKPQEVEDNITVIQEDENITIDKLRLISSSANVKKLPFLHSQTLRVMKRADIVQIENCDNFGWCKIKDEDGYIQKYLFLDVK